MHKYYTFTSDLQRIARLIDAEQVPSGYELSLRRIFKDFKHAQGLVKGDKLRKELPQLRSLDIDFYYKPGNENIGGHGAIDLDFIKNTAVIKCLGDWDWFRPIFDRWAPNLGLQLTESQVTKDFVLKLQSSLSDELFDLIKAPLDVGQHTVALSAAVVFIEDRLRRKLGPGAIGMTGPDLSVYAFKNPGVLRPPLAGATNAEEGAFLILKGWFGLVRNLHGHQTSFAMTHNEVRAQLNGCNYVLWLIDNSVVK
jgi:hypothetical protein